MVENVSGDSNSNSACIGLRSQITSASTCIAQLTSTIDDLEYRSWRNNIIIYGIAEETNEDADCLATKVASFFTKMYRSNALRSIGVAHTDDITPIVPI